MEEQSEPQVGNVFVMKKTGTAVVIKNLLPKNRAEVQILSTTTLKKVRVSSFDYKVADSLGQLAEIVKEGFSI